MLLITSGRISGQPTSYNYYFRVYFKDKGSYTTSSFTLSQLVSSKAVERRQKAGIIDVDFRDLPVYTDYLNKIISSGFRLHCTSKWLNSALFKSQSETDINLLLGFPFVKEVKIVKKPVNKGIVKDKLYFETEMADLPPYDRPITMVNGYPLHNSGFIGKNILIAVLDGGFLNGDKINSIDHLRNSKGILKTYDFVNNVNEVYNSSTHGTAVLSILAGMLPQQLEGTAQGADYILLKTEDVRSEFPCEEDFWAAGAEFADSSGADIISSSLGYYNFDDASMNYKYSDLDGNSAFVTRAADIAAAKGILVVTSAGNERDKAWKRIIFPSDGDSVLCSGAVDANNYISYFSSAGPAYDGSVKPDIVTLGVNVPIQTSPGPVLRGNGTSFSCPVLSGMAACLMQAVPQALNSDIIEALHSGSDRHNSPDSLYGYGIPDMTNVLNILQDKLIIHPDKESVVKPNPTSGDFEIILSEPQTTLTIEIFTITGKVLYRKDFNNFAGRSLLMTELSNRQSGVYLIRMKTASGTTVQKIIKVK